MTVVASTISDKKLPKQVLVTADVENGGNNNLNSNQSNTVIISTADFVPSLNWRPPSNRKRLCLYMYHIFMFFVVVFGLLAISMGGVYFVGKFIKSTVRHYKGWCNIPYIEKMSPEDMEKMVELEPFYAQMKQDFAPPTDTFYEEFDIDLGKGEYEKIDIPEFSKGRKGRFIHDFTINKTAILDLEDRRCFVMDLDRSQVLPPKDLFDKITKMQSGYDTLDTEVIRETYSVVLPSLDQSERSTLGFYISESCYDLPIYRLEKVTSHQNSIVKRSTPVSYRENTFVEFAGSHITRIQIADITKAPGRRLN